MPTFFYFLEICHETCLFHSPPNYIIPFSFKIWVTRMYPIYTQNFNYFNYFNKKNARRPYTLTKTCVL